MAESPFASFVLGTRPVIIKLAPVIRECINRGHAIEIIHTGQHYSDELDSVFFEDLNLPAPAYNLGVGSASHGAQTGQMIEQVESILLDTESKNVIVHGDTNSTLAGAIAATKLETTLAHVEAGLRSGNESLPEETNRTLVDHASDQLFVPTAGALNNLYQEGIEEGVHVTGNTIVDAVVHYREVAVKHSSILAELGIEPEEFLLLTAHRAHNVDDSERFTQLLEGVRRLSSELEQPVIYPIHPRARNTIETEGIDIPENVRLIKPLGFLDFLRLEDTTTLAMTDSGGVQEETCILQTPCITLRKNTERPETVEVGANRIVGVEPARVYDGGLTQLEVTQNWENPLGDGHTAARIVNTLN